MTTWVDATGYGQGDPRQRTPRTWEAKFAWLRVCVTRHMDFSPDTWLLRAHDVGLELVILSSRDLKDAQAEAVLLVRARLEQALAALPLRNKPRRRAKK